MLFFKKMAKKKAIRIRIPKEQVRKRPRSRPQPSKPHRDKTQYSRKTKHKKRT